MNLLHSHLQFCSPLTRPAPVNTNPVFHPYIAPRVLRRACAIFLLIPSTHRRSNVFFRISYGYFSAVIVATLHTILRLPPLQIVAVTYLYGRPITSLPAGLTLGRFRFSAGTKGHAGQHQNRFVHFSLRPSRSKPKLRRKRSSELSPWLHEDFRSRSFCASCPTLSTILGDG
jgi:hypothetical protein